MMSREILYPTEVTAYRHGADNQVVIIAKGREDGYRKKFKLKPSMAQIYPPIYHGYGRTKCSAIGDFPYTVQKTVRILNRS